MVICFAQVAQVVGAVGQAWGSQHMLGVHNQVDSITQYMWSAGICHVLIIYGSAGMHDRLE